MTVRAKSRLSPAHEAQKFFFELGMVQRMKTGAKLAELGLSFSQAHALRLLDPDEPMPMSALAERLFCDASNVTGIADRLETRGLVRRESLAGDRRVKALTITPSGMKLRRQVMELMSQPPDAIAALGNPSRLGPRANLRLNVSAEALETRVARETPEVQAWAQLLRAHSALTRRFSTELLTMHGLTLSGYEVLLHLAHTPDQRLRRVDLAERVLLTPSGITRPLDGLER